MSNTQKFFLKSEADTFKLAADIAEQLASSSHQEIIYLQGQLGAGKTTFVRGFLKALGFKGHVKSPTYTMVESYQINDRLLFHFDLYRVSDPEALQALGLEDYLTGNAICIFEWPELGKGWLPAATLSCKIESAKDGERWFYLTRKKGQ